VSVYTRRLGAVRFAEGGTLLMHTAAAGKVTILRDVIVGSSADTPANVSIYIETGTGQILWILGIIALEQSQTVHLELRQEMLPGETLWASGSPAPFTAMATGYVFAE